MGDPESRQKWKDKQEAIKQEEIMLEEPWVKSELSCIPFVIWVLYPTIDEDEFHKYENDWVFMDWTTFVCEECYLHIS